MVNTVSGIPCGLIALLPRQVKSGHYDNTSMQYTAIIHGCKNGNFLMQSDFFRIFALKQRSWVLVRTATLTSTDNLCFTAKIRK